jgi:TfoX/Sxy family transcriptional regulator of competence genes
MRPGEATPLGLARLKAVFDGALAGLEGVEPKRLFGCDAYFVNGNIFAVVLKEGRLGLRLTEARSRDALRALPGAEPWIVGDRAVRFWVLLPPAFHGRPARLKEWAREAWRQGVERPPGPAVSGRKGPRSIRPAVFRRLS